MQITPIKLFINRGLLTLMIRNLRLRLSARVTIINCRLRLLGRALMERLTGATRARLPR